MQRQWVAFASLLIALIAALSPAPSNADGTTGVLSGYVTDIKSGRPLQFAKVELSWRGQRPFATAMTDRNGHYVFISVTPGTYTAQASFDREDRSMYSSERCGPFYEAVIDANQTTSINFPLYDAVQTLGHVTTMCYSRQTIAVTPMGMSSLYTYGSDW